MTSKFGGYGKRLIRRHSISGLPPETRKSQINDLTFHLEEVEKE